MPLKLFIDFDGTITRHDVGNVFFRTFGGERCTELVAAYRQGEISAHACFLGEAEALGHVDESAVQRFLYTMELRDGLPELLATCRRLGIDRCIVSDGLDYYIRTILAHASVTAIPFFANSFLLSYNGSEGNIPSLRFPFSNAECDRCACCKRNIMLRNAGRDDVIAYVGDGFSDRCPVQYADIVFARGELQTYCQEQNISYRLFDSLAEVGTHLENLIQRKRLRKRPGAELARQQLFIGEA
jgi:2-hydroxy-3-keto-5-methylthiopentenyl-1-phosphate phosphatase